MTSFTFYKVFSSVVASLNLTSSFLFLQRDLLCGRELKLDQFFSFYKVLNPSRTFRCSGLDYVDGNG